MNEGNVFNVIRWPVSIRFEEEDLARLPPALLTQWWASFYNSICRSHDPLFAERFKRIPPEPARIHCYLHHTTKMKLRHVALDQLKACKVGLAVLAGLVVCFVWFRDGREILGA